MSTVLRVIGVLSIIGGIISGFVNAKSYSGLEKLLGRSVDIPFQWSIALTWWVSGIISGIIFFALAMMLDKLDNIEYNICELQNSTAKPISPTEKPNYAAKIPNTKMSLDSAKDYKMKSLD